MKDSEFNAHNEQMIAEMGQADGLRKQTHAWFDLASRYEYSYHFRWLGVPIIQFPQDVVAMQEIVWNVKPDLIIETGIARGGSLIFYASMLHLLGNNGRVVGVDIDIRDHNREIIESHPMFRYVTMIQGSSVAPEVVSQVQALADQAKTVMVVLDSMHTHDHVLAELRAYAPMVTNGSYLTVLDTCIVHMDDALFPDRPWDKRDNPHTAVMAYLNESDRFVIDEAIHHKLQITVAPDGYLKCVKDA